MYSKIRNKTRDKSETLTTTTIRLLIGEAIITIAIQLRTVTTTMAMPTATIPSVSHSNTIYRLYILRNIYSESISIKEIYSFLI